MVITYWTAYRVVKCKCSTPSTHCNIKMLPKQWCISNNNIPMVTVCWITEGSRAAPNSFQWCASSHLFEVDSHGDKSNKFWFSCVQWVGECSWPHSSLAETLIDCTVSTAYVKLAWCAPSGHCHWCIWPWGCSHGPAKLGLPCPVFTFTVWILQASDHVSMNTNIPFILFWIQYPPINTGHVNSIFRLDFQN